MDHSDDTHSSHVRYAANYGRMRELIELLELPAAGRRGSRVNQLRARIVRAAVHQLKVAGAGACWIRKARGHCTLCKVALPWRLATLR